jgi:hypothetical protein
MPIVSQQSQALVLSLINSSNPSLPFPIDATQVKFEPCAAITPANGTIQDTQVRIVALPGGKYAGNVMLSYRRLDPSVIFRSVPIVINLYSAAAAGSSPYKMSQLLPYINAKYGLNLQIADIVDVSFPAGNTNANPSYGIPAGVRNAVATLTFATGCLAWKNSVQVCWAQAPQNLATLLATTSLEQSLTYPGYSNTVGSSLYVPNLDSYPVDFTDALAAAYGVSPLLSTTIPTWNGAALSTSSTYTPILTALNAANIPGHTYTVGQGTPQGSQKFDLTGALIYGNIDLTQAANQALYPESDYRYFDRAILIRLQTGNTWGAGDLFMHYNV